MSELRKLNFKISYWKNRIENCKGFQRQIFYSYISDLKIEKRKYLENLNKGV